MLEKEKKKKKTIEIKQRPSSDANLEQKINEPTKEILNILMEADKIHVSSAKNNIPAVEKLSDGALPKMAHPSKSSEMSGLYLDGKLVAIKKTYGQAPEAGKVRKDGQNPANQGHSYEISKEMATATQLDILRYQEQMEAIGVNVPALLWVEANQITEEAEGLHSISFAQEFIDGFDFEEVIKLAINNENLKVLQILIDSVLDYLKKIIDYKVSLKDEIFQTQPKKDELAVALDIKPNNFTISIDAQGKPFLWFIDLFAPGNRDKEQSIPFIRRFMEQSEGDISWKFYHERLIKKSGIYCKFIMELKTIIFKLNIPSSLKKFYLEEIVNQIEKFIATNDETSLADFKQSRSAEFDDYLEISGRAERKRFDSIIKKQPYIPQEHIIPPENGEWPEIDLIVGPCRTGTTALQRALLPSEEPSFYQVLKHLRRNDDAGINTNWQVPNGSKSKKIILKETLGPYTPSEIFDPIQDLLVAGCPKDKIKVLVVLRDPKITHKSWGKTFKISPASEKIFFASWSYVRDIITSLQVKGIKYQTIFQEQLINNSEVMLKNVCKFFDIKYTKSMLDWTDDHSSNSIIEPILEPEWYAKRFQDPTGNGQANPITATQKAPGFRVPVYAEEEDDHPIFSLIREFLASLANEEPMGEISND